MILYNVTVGIDKEVEQDWLDWMRNEHIPKVLNTGAFSSYKMYKVLSHEDEETISYSVQYFSDQLLKVDQYFKIHASILSEELRKRYENRHVAFQTVLQEII